ncbi:hypothetical protein Q3G72_018770 [Acer saccharum]|nr:hypothetical protein Q3G72_018770 [Acer saccharum]
MGRPCFNKLLIFSVLLLLCFSHGFGRQLMVTGEFEDSSTVQVQEARGESREMIEVMDYKDPGPNTNPKAGYIFSPPPSQA